MQGVYIDGLGVVFERSGPDEILLAYAFSKRRVFSRWELLESMKVVALVGRWLGLRAFPSGQLLEALIDIVVADDMERANAIKVAYKKPAPQLADNDLPLDTSLCDVLEEMALTDQVNAGDLKAFKDDLKRRTIHNLHRQRLAAWQ